IRSMASSSVRGGGATVGPTVISTVSPSRSGNARIGRKTPPWYTARTVVVMMLLLPGLTPSLYQHGLRRTGNGHGFPFPFGADRSRRKRTSRPFPPASISVIPQSVYCPGGSGGADGTMGGSLLVGIDGGVGGGVSTVVGVLGVLGGSAGTLLAV